MRVRQLWEIWFRLRNGYWHDHPSAYEGWRNLQRRTDGSGWEMIDCGMRQMRQCLVCGYTEFR